MTKLEQDSLSDLVQSAAIESICGYLIPVVHLTEATEWAKDEISNQLLTNYPDYLFIVVCVHKRQWCYYTFSSDGKFDVLALVKDFNGTGNRDRAICQVPQF